MMSAGLFLVNGTLPAQKMWRLKKNKGPHSKNFRNGQTTCFRAADVQASIFFEENFRLIEQLTDNVVLMAIY